MQFFQVEVADLAETKPDIFQFFLPLGNTLSAGAKWILKVETVLYCIVSEKQKTFLQHPYAIR